MLRRIARIVWLCTLGVLALVGVVLATAQLTLQTRWGREQLRTQVARAVSQALHARFELDRIDAASLWYVRGAGLRIVQGEQRLASVERFAIRFQPLALLAGRVSVTNAALFRPYVAMGAPFDEGGGLLALIDNATETSPPATSSSGGGLVIALEGLRADDARVDVAFHGARFAFSKLSVRGGVEVGSHISIRVSDFACDASRNDVKVAQLRGHGLRYADSDAIAGRVRVTMPTAELVAKLSLSAEDAAGARRVDARASVRHLSPESLAALGLASDWLLSSVDLALEASGSTRAGHFGVTLATAGGDVQLTGELAHWREVTAVLRSNGFDTRRVLRDGYPPLSARIELRAEAAPDYRAARLELTLRDGSYATASLPRTDLNAWISRTDGIVIDSLRARFADSPANLDARGRLSPDGALAASVHARADSLARVGLLRTLAPTLAGSLTLDSSIERDAGGPLHGRLALSVTHAAFGALRADQLQLDATAEGRDLSSANGVAHLHAGGLALARMRFAQARFDLRADPHCVVALGDFGSQGELHVRVDRLGEAFFARGGADLLLEPDQRLRLELGSIRYARGGLALEGVRLSLGQATARIDGRFERRGTARLEAAADVPDLRPITGLVLAEPIGGRLEVAAVVSGTARRPRATLNGRYRAPQLLGLRDVDLELQASADLERRRLDTKVQAHARDTVLSLETHTELHGSELSSAAVEQGKHEIALELTRLPLTELSAFPSARLRMTTAELSGKLALHGTLRAPELSAQLKARTLFSGDRDAMDLEIDADYADSRIALDLRAVDSAGPLLDAQVQSDFEPHAVFAAHVEDLGHALTERAWQAELNLHARRVQALPALHAIPIQEALLPWRVSAHAKLAHRPGVEPDGELDLQALFDPGSEPNHAPRCGAAGNPRLALIAKMADGALVAHAKLQVAGKNVVGIDTHSPAPIDEWLRPSPPQPLDLVASLDRLRFAAVPVLCDQLDGELSGRVQLVRALSQKLQLNVDLKAKQVAWNHAPKFDAWLEAHADRANLIAKASLNGAGGAATFTAKLPLDAKARVPVPRTDVPVAAEARLQAMSVPALLGGVPGVSADGGRVDGVVTLSGSLAEPYLTGGLALDKVSMTLGAIGQRFEDVSGQLRFHGRSVHLAKTRVHDRDGVLDVSGDVALQGPGQLRLALLADAKRYPVRRDGVVLGTFDGRLQLAAQVTPQRKTINLTLRKATIELSEDDLGGVQSLAANPDVHFLDVRAGDRKADPDDAAAETVIQIDAREPLWIRREDFSAQVSTHMTIAVRGEEEPEITGRIEIERGVIELVGQLFDIERGSIELSGGHGLEPTLDLTARRRLPGGTSVEVQASGRLHEPTLAFLVDDRAVSSEEALAALSGGGATSSASMQDQFTSVATGMAAGVLTMGARRQLGEWMPVLAVESASNATRLRAGVEARRLIPKFLRKLVVDAYVEGMVSSTQDSSEPSADDVPPSAQTQAAVLMELRFPHRLVGEAQYGPLQRWSADLSWEP